MGVADLHVARHHLDEPHEVLQFRGDVVCGRGTHMVSRRPVWTACQLRSCFPGSPETRGLPGSLPFVKHAFP